MGWTYHFTDSTDRKAEVEKVVNGTVIKSRMLGSVYYGAWQIGDKVMGVVALTRLKDGEFGMKVVDETMGPIESRCPDSILDCLTDTDSDHALAWRCRCRKYNEAMRLLKTLPYGSKVVCEGETYTKKKFGNRRYWVSALGYRNETDIADKGFMLT